ncbi:MAG TPA: hypothetical protein VN618_02270 [Solirubrobacteraceae bacterium]|nr:hypothetical protein [Solirubrobacteraceae bacterium]
MRKVSMGCLAVLGLVALSLPASAAAVPTVTVKAKIVAIKGFPGTGNKLGAGAAVESEVTISGTEYGGFPPPLIGVNVFLPKGTVLHPSGFPVCKPEILEPNGIGPKGCPKGSAAGPVGKATGVVAFGTEIVPETVTIEPFYAPGGGLEFFTFGHSPVLLEILSKAHYVGASGLYSKELIAEVPLVETVPGAQDASVKTISVKVGSAIRKNGKAIYYGRVPKKCPKGGFPAKAELTFAGLGGLTQTTVTKTLKVPCPRR